MERLATYLKETGLTQQDLASRVGVRQPTVSDWLNGKVNPSVETLKVLSLKTGISIDELLGHSVGKKRKRA